MAFGLPSLLIPVATDFDFEALRGLRRIDQIR